MSSLVAIFGALMAGLGVTGVASPATLMRLVTSVWRSKRGIYLALSFRLVMGVILVAAAPSCRFPHVVLAVGILALLGAVVIPLLGFQRLRAFVDWWASRSALFIRSWALVASGFGAFLVYAGV